MDWNFDCADENVFVSFLLLLAFAKNIYVDDVDFRDVGEVKLLAPKEKIRF